jgi:ADP-ribose pyrophosphatase
MSTITRWQELYREKAFKKYTHSIDKVIFKMPGGEELDYYIKTSDASVCVVALTTDGKIILTRQFRPGPQKILTELPGGFVDDNEDSEVAAGRELLEETGYKGEIEFVAEYHDDAYSEQKMSCYVAKNCVKVSEPEQTATEHNEAVLLSVDEFRKLLRSGQMTDLQAGYLGLDYLGLL